jgi:beta-lactamase class C
MKILKESFTRTTKRKFPLLLSIRSVVLSVCVLLPALNAQAQTEKQISYPVAIPVARAAASSAASAAVTSQAAIKAPAPVIRPLAEATTPPVRARAPAKNTTAAKPATKSPATKSIEVKPIKATPKKTTAKPPVTKTSVTSISKKTVATTAKKPTAKPEPKTTKNTDQATAKKPEAKKLANTKPEAAAVKTPAPVRTKTASLAGEIQPLPPIHTPISATKNITNNVVAAVAAGATLAAAGVSAEEERELASSLADEENFLEEPELPAAIVSKTTASAPTTLAASANLTAKTSLPMSNQREAFVTEFKNFVETNLVPRAPGLALAIIADGKVKVLQTYGVKKVGTNSLVNADTTFRLASVSKSFGATAAAMLVNDGLIRWDTKITDVLPTVEFSNPRYGDQLTVQHILSQSTGLPTHSGDNYIEDGLPFDAVVEKLKAVNFVCPPGKCYNYQNVTYSLISKIVLKKTGMTYEQYLESKIFHPLGMQTATVGFAGYSVNGNYAVPHIPTRKGWAPTTVTEHYYRINPAAGVNASIADMSRWVLAHMGQNPNVLSPTILNAVHAKVTRNTPAQNHYGSREGVTDSHYGLGWRVFDYRGDKNFVHHGGGVKGFRSEVVFNPELKIGMVILTNGPRLSGSVIFDFLDAYEDEKRGARKNVAAAAPVKKNKK